MNFEWVVSFYRITKKKRKQLWKNYSSFLWTSQRSWTLYRCTCYRWPAGHRYLTLRLTHLSQLGLKLEDWDRLIQKHLLFCFGVFFFFTGKITWQARDGYYPRTRICFRFNLCNLLLWNTTGNRFQNINCCTKWRETC